MATHVLASRDSHNPFLRLRAGLGGGMVGILAYDFFVGQVLISRGKPPETPPPEPGEAGEPAAERETAHARGR